MAIDSCIRPDWTITDLLGEPWELVDGDEWYHTPLKVVITVGVILGSLLFALIPICMILHHKCESNTIGEDDGHDTDDESTDSDSTVEVINPTRAATMLLSDGLPPPERLREIPYFLFTHEADEAFWKDVIESVADPDLIVYLRRECQGCTTTEELREALINILQPESIESISISNPQDQMQGNKYLHEDILLFTKLKHIQFINCGTLFKEEDFEDILSQMKSLENITIFNQDEDDMRMYPESSSSEESSTDDEEWEEPISPSLLERLRDTLQPIPKHYFDSNGWFKAGSPPASEGEPLPPPDFVTEIPAFLNDLPNLKTIEIVGSIEGIRIPPPIRHFVNHQRVFWTDTQLTT